MQIEQVETSDGFVSDLAREFQESLTGTVLPMREHLAKIEQAIETREVELNELRKLRTYARRIIAVVDPEMQVQGRRKTPQKTQTKGSLRASPGTLNNVEQWLVENVRNGETFYAAGLVKEKGYDLTSDSLLSAALVQLADSGRIRLDSLGGPRSTSQKNYKLVG